MPDTVDRLSLVAERLMENAELVSAQMRTVAAQLQEILMAGFEEEDTDGE